MQPLKHRESSTRARSTDPGLLEAKGLGLELKNLVKSRDPWNREVEFQRDATRKAYLKVIFSTPSLTSSSLALLSSSTRSSSNAAANSTALEALNLLWLETTHALITVYRARLAKMDKKIAENPKPPSRKSLAADKRGGNGGNVQYADPAAAPGSKFSASVPGAVARRKLLQQFRKFLNSEQDYWKLIVARLASRLSPTERSGLAPLGIFASNYDDTNTSSQENEQEISEDEKRRRRLEVLPLAHKALIFYGDLARYIEHNGDGPALNSAAPTGGGGSRSRRTGKKNEKTYAKAAGCYRQAIFLMPEDGNSHNQLAVLQQYSLEPLASNYHYYRALTVRNPFTTAGKNLSIAYSKTLQRYDFGSERRRHEQMDGRDTVRDDQPVRFREAFMALHGIFFTKNNLSELGFMMSTVADMFQICTQERLLDTEEVLRIVITSLAALWHARLTRSKALNDTSALQLSKAKSASEADVARTLKAPESQPSAPEGPKLEAHILVHVLELYTTLLSTSSAETNELYAANCDDLENPSRSAPKSHSNISAVVRRSVPALRILGKWLREQLDYIERVQKRLVDKEKKRLRAKTRTSGGASSLEEAQRSLDSSGGGGGRGGENTEADRQIVVPSHELDSALDRFWMAFADYSNSIKLAFPHDYERVLKVEDGVWLEEDVECLGFAPLRQRLSDNTPDEARKVGRDLHPNDEVILRLDEAQQLAEEMVESPLSRIDSVDGAYVFVAHGGPNFDQADQQAEVRIDQEPLAAIAVEEQQHDEDAEMKDQSTEDDPVDRAMRTAANQLELDGVDEDDASDPDDSEGEQIVFSGSRNSSQPPAPNAPDGPAPSHPGYLPRQDNFLSRSPNRSSTLTAADLRQQLFAPDQPRASLLGSTTPARTNPLSVTALSHSSPPLLAPATSASPHALSSIWGTVPAPSNASARSSSGLGGPSSLASVPPHHAMTAHSFEAIPNLTHDSLAAHQLGWGALPNLASASPSSPGPTLPLPPPPHSSAQPPSIPAAQLFGGHEAFSLPAHAVPPPPPPPVRQPYEPPHPSPLYGPPGLSTAQVGLNPAPLPPPLLSRMSSHGQGGRGPGQSYGSPLSHPALGGAR